MKFFAIRWISSDRKTIGQNTYATYEAARKDARKTSVVRKDKYEIIECVPIKGEEND